MRYLLACALLASVPVQAVAGSRDAVHAVQIGKETVRFRQGVPTLDLWTPRGGVQITPMPIASGRINFVVTVFNNLEQPVNFGAENIKVENGEQPVIVMTKEDLIRKAEKKAFWSSFGLAILGGLAAGAAASQTNTYTSSTYSRYGSFHSVARYPSLAGQLQADRITADTSYAIAAMQHRLDETKERLQYELVQLSTVDPGDTYGGRIILGKLKSSKVPQDVRVTIDWNGDKYSFAFRLDKAGSPAPPFTSITPVRLPDYVQTREEQDQAGAEREPKSALVPRVSAPDGSRPIDGGRLLKAKTASGFCIDAGRDYRGTGSKNRPSVTSGMPRCAT